MKNLKKTFWFAVTVLMVPAVLFGLDIKDFEGKWEWPIPVFKEGVMKIEKWQIYTLEVNKTKQGYSYIQYNEINKQIDNGICYIEKELLVLKSAASGSKKLFNIHSISEDNHMFELSTAMGAGPIITISRMEEAELESDPVKAESLAKEARASNDEGDYQKAIELADEAIRYDNNCLSAWFQKGFVLGALKRYEEAIECYKVVLEIDPDYESAKKNIKWSQDKMKK